MTDHFGGRVTLAGMLLFATTAQAAKQADNAALAYWQAFAQLPVVDSELEKLVADAAVITLDERTGELIRKSRAALTAMQRAAAKPECEWGP